MPQAVGEGIFSSDGDHRELRSLEQWVVPFTRCRSAGGFQELTVLHAGYWVDGQFERMDPDSMGRCLIRLTGVASHNEPAFRNLHESFHLEDDDMLSTSRNIRLI